MIRVLERTEFDDRALLEYNYFYSNPLTRVTIRDLSRNITATGWARCDPTDIYDSEFGEILALTRALARFNKKIEKWLVRNMYGV